MYEDENVITQAHVDAAARSWRESMAARQHKREAEAAAARAADAGDALERVEEEEGDPDAWPPRGAGDGDEPASAFDAQYFALLTRKVELEVAVCSGKGKLLRTTGDVYKGQPLCTDEALIVVPQEERGPLCPVSFKPVESVVECWRRTEGGGDASPPPMPHLDEFPRTHPCPAIGRAAAARRGSRPRSCAISRPAARTPHCAPACSVRSGPRMRRAC